MLQLSENDAEKLTAEQATELVHILDLQARWENDRDDPAKSAASVADLHGRQKAFEAFRAAWRKYAAAYHDARLPEPTQNVPDRMAVWLRALRAVLRRTDGAGSAALLSKVYRLADRMAVRTGREPVARGAAGDTPTAALALDAVVAWCEERVAPALDTRKAA